jgi:hypothetical protein
VTWLRGIRAGEVAEPGNPKVMSCSSRCPPRPHLHGAAGVVHLHEEAGLELVPAQEHAILLRQRAAGDPRSRPMRVQSRPWARIDSRFRTEVTWNSSPYAEPSQAARALHRRPDGEPSVTGGEPPVTRRSSTRAAGIVSCSRASRASARASAAVGRLRSRRAWPQPGVADGRDLGRVDRAWLTR